MSSNLSIEFFPPQTPEGAAKLRTTADRLAVLKPDFFSVTYGAGGSTQERTFATIRELTAAGYSAAPHLSCIGSTHEKIRAILDEFTATGIRRIVALRGDLPSGSGDPGEFRYANELVEFIRKETGDRFQIEVAAYPEWHPQARSPEDDLNAFVRKANAGASSAITQYFYNVDAYFHFVEAVQKRGCTIPIVPGIMPIGSFSKLARFSDMCGAEIPRWMRKRFEALGDDSAAVRELGLEIVTNMCRQLLDAGAPGLHFYSMNQADLTLEVVGNLKA